jgi:hypothetical protein
MSYESNWGSLISQISSEELSLKDLITKLNYWDQFNPAYQFKSNEFIEKNTVNIIYDNNIKTVTIKEAASLKRQSVMSTIGSQIDDSVDAVIELGSGFGRNIFMLYEEFSSKYPNVTYIAGEYTAGGQDVCSAIVKKYDLPIISLHFNYYDWSSLYSFIIEKNYKNICFYTSYSVEQIPYLDKQLFLDLLKINNIKFTHIEPVGFQMENGNPQYSGNPNYNQNLIQILTDLENENLIKIDTYKPDWFCGDGGFHNVGSLIQWRKI